MGNTESVKEFLNSCKVKEKSYIFAVLTDKIIFDSMSPESDHFIKGEAHKVLELRVFDETQEYKLFRGKVKTENNEIIEYNFNRYVRNGKPIPNFESKDFINKHAIKFRYRKRRSVYRLL